MRGEEPLRPLWALRGTETRCSVHSAYFSASAIPTRIATRVDGTLYYVHSDLLGSTVALSDATGGEV